MTAEQATAAAMARVGNNAPPATLNTTHWALSGLPDKPQTPLGAKAKSDAGSAAPSAATPTAHAPAAAAPVKCLEGVRRLPGVAGPAQPQGC
jgi:hypothetical protein